MRKKQKKRGLGKHPKATLLTHRHIVKGSSSRLPFATANEHLCMQVVAKVLPTAKTELSEDGNVLVVHRFDVDESGKPFRALEDFCSLLGLRPAQKYETTWERIAKAVRAHVPGRDHYETFQKLTAMLLLTYALRNADCHAKNIALLYTSRDDASLAPAYDFFTTSVYAGYQHNPPGIGLMGKKTWLPGKTLARFITANLRHPGKGAASDGRAHQRCRCRHRPGSSRDDGQLAWLQGHGQADAGGVERGCELTAGFPDVQPEPVEVEARPSRASPTRRSWRTQERSSESRNSSLVKNLSLVALLSYISNISFQGCVRDFVVKGASSPTQ
jgi:hypothetical protein